MPQLTKRCFILYTIIVFYAVLPVYAWLPSGNAPDAVIDKIIEVANENSKVWGDFNLSRKYITDNLWGEREDYILKDGYSLYYFPLKNNYIGFNILYDSQAKKAYILNKGYSYKMISVVIKGKYGCIGNIINEPTRLEGLSGLIFREYSWEFGYCGSDIFTATEKAYNYKPCVIPEKISKEELMKTFIPPQIVIRRDKKWILSFIAYPIDGIVMRYEVVGKIDDGGYLEIEEIKTSPIYRVGTLKITKEDCY